MASVVICGGSVIGATTAMLLARDGHEVTVLERDPAPPPADPFEAWAAWERKGVAQFHQPHNLFPRFRWILDSNLPEMVGKLVDAGCVWRNPIEQLPPFIEDREPRPGDDRFPFVTGRRPVVEAVLSRAAEEEKGVTFRRGVSVAELVTGPSALDGVPHMTGVRTADGERLEADLVIDAMGRRSKLGDLLVAAGGRQPFVDSVDVGFVYYTRYFAGTLPETIGPAVAEIGTFNLLTLPGDNGTWSLTIWAPSSDTLLREVQDPERFARVIAACPLYAHWLEGEPITEVLSMAGILDRYRRMVVDGQPVATGIAAVGDAWACTNPSAGRGMTVGLIQAERLRNVVCSDLEEPVAFAMAYDQATEADVAPFYWSQIEADRYRIAEMNALREGTERPPQNPVSSVLGRAMVYDPDVFRAMVELLTCMALPDEVLSRPGLLEKAQAVAEVSPGLSIPGPDRAELLELLA